MPAFEDIAATTCKGCPSLDKALARYVHTANQAHALSLVCDVWDVTLEGIRSPRRDGNLLVARAVFWHLLTDAAGMSPTEIGEKYGRDRTTIVYNLGSLAKQRASDGALDVIVTSLVHEMKSFGAGLMPPPASFWTPARDAGLVAMWASTMTDGEIAEVLGCRPVDVPHRATALGVMSDSYPVHQAGALAEAHS